MLILSFGANRAAVSNQLAHSGKSWAQIFSMHHSGTYANQWMVLDYQKFTAGSPPKPHFLTVLEEVPGYIHYEDMTSKLIVSPSLLVAYCLISYLISYFVGGRLLGKLQ